MDLRSRTDPDLLEVLDSLPIIDYSDVVKARETSLRMLLDAMAGVDPDPNVLREDVNVPGAAGDPDVLLRIYRPAEPASTAAPCLYWIHGGGHVIGAVDQDDLEAEHYVREIGCVVVSVDWRRAPEHPYPDPMEDCYAGLAWTFQNAHSLAVDPKRIAIGGRSSGGGSAAGLALLARDRGEHSICFQVLIYPMLDDRNVTFSSQAIVHPRVWNRDSNRIGWRAYLGGTTGDDVPIYAAPSRALDLTRLPPAFVSVGDTDLLLDEALDYAQRLIQAGVPTELHVYPGAFHGFEVLAPTARVSVRANRDRDEALRRAFGVGEPLTA